MRGCVKRRTRVRVNKCTSMHVSLEAAPYDNAELYDKEQFNGLVKDTKHAYRDKSEAQYGSIAWCKRRKIESTKFKNLQPVAHI